MALGLTGSGLKGWYYFIVLITYLSLYFFISKAIGAIIMQYIKWPRARSVVMN
jgi:hypothetical protein